MSLANRVVLITGAKGGLGSAVTRAFLAAGCRVAGVSRSIRDEDFSNPSFAAFPSALDDSAAARSVAEVVAAKWGSIWALVHLVGGFAGGTPVEETTEDVVDRMLETNFRTAFFMFQAVIPVLRRNGGGRIIAIGSRSAVEPQPQSGAYSASKAALVSLVRTVALENRDYGITANIVLPGTMDTPANRTAMPEADFSRWVRPEGVASLLVYLASAEAASINGAALPAYGKDS